jgi:Niemann-Pick C1 protein
MRRLCGASTCDSNSLQSLVSSASFFPKKTYIAQSTVNWIDDYIEWLSSDPQGTSCCFTYKNSTKFCDHKKLVDEHSDKLESCIPCTIDRSKYNLPSGNTMIKYVDNFLHQNPSIDCIKAGHAMYGNAVKLIKNKMGHLVRIGRKFQNLTIIKFLKNF